MAEEKSELSSLQDRLKAMRDKQMAMEKEKQEQDQKPKKSPTKPAPKDQTPVAPEPKAPPSPAPESPPQEGDDATARIRERLKKASASQAPEEQPPQRPEKQADAPTKMPPEPEKQAQDEPQPTAKPENPADRLRALLEKHRQDQQQRALGAEAEEEEAASPPRPEPKPASSPPEPIEAPAPLFDPAPAPTFSPPRSAADLYQGGVGPAAAPVRIQPTLRYRLRVHSDKLKKTKVGKVIFRGLSLVMRLAAAASLVVLVGISLAFMADRYCRMNDLLLAYCQKGMAPPEACQRDYGMFDVTDMRYWQQLQNYYDSGFIIPWPYVYVMGGHALAALVLGLMGLYHGPRVYRKILRFLTFPLRKLGFFKTL